MSPRSISEIAFVEVPLLHLDDTVEMAVARLLEVDVPALPVVDANERYAGIFGEREFMSALFPGYIGQLKHSAFLSHSIDVALEKRDGCRSESIERHITTEHVEVSADYSDVQVAEIFLHHRVLVVPVIEDGRVAGVLTRSGFFRTLGERFVKG